MKVTYDPEVDVLRILFSNAPTEESDKDKPGVIIDYDKDGNVVGMEILDASKRMDNPRAMDYAVIGGISSRSQSVIGIEEKNEREESTLATLEKVVFIEKLLTFLQEGFQNPGSVLKYLQNHSKCSDVDCKTRGCERLIPYFSGTRTWNRNSLDEFFTWSRQWYKPNQTYYEEPINAVFTFTLVRKFLTDKIRLSVEEVRQAFQIEFKGGGKLKSFVPPCLWKGKSPVCSGKKFGNHEMCCDFYLKDHKDRFPTLVGEIKVAVPQQKKNTLANFLKDIEKCREWLKPDTSKYISDKFKIKRFEYALAIFIDLTGDDKYSNVWKSNINQDDYLQENIIVRHIQVDKF